MYVHVICIFQCSTPCGQPHRPAGLLCGFGKRRSRHQKTATLIAIAYPPGNCGARRQHPAGSAGQLQSRLVDIELNPPPRDTKSTLTFRCTTDARHHQHGGSNDSQWRRFIVTLPVRQSVVQSRRCRRPGYAAKIGR